MNAGVMGSGGYRVGCELTIVCQSPPDLSEAERLPGQPGHEGHLPPFRRQRPGGAAGPMGPPRLGGPVPVGRVAVIVAAGINLYRLSVTNLFSAAPIAPDGTPPRFGSAPSGPARSP